MLTVSSKKRLAAATAWASGNPETPAATWPILSCCIGVSKSSGARGTARSGEQWPDLVERR
jgi:hypothetical protein